MRTIDTQGILGRTALATASAAIGLFLAPLGAPDLGGSLSLTSQAYAAEGGKGGPSDKGRGGPSASGQQGKPAATGQGSTGITGGKVGRLNMARAFVSPGFDIAKVDDPDAPIAQIALFKETITGDYSVPTKDVAGTALGNAATVNPVTLETVKKVLGILQVTTTWTDAQLTLVAEKATEVLLSRRTEEETTKVAK